MHAMQGPTYRTRKKNRTHYNSALRALCKILHKQFSLYCVVYVACVTVETRLYTATISHNSKCACKLCTGIHCLFKHPINAKSHSALSCKWSVIDSIMKHTFHERPQKLFHFIRLKLLHWFHRVFAVFRTYDANIDLLTGLIKTKLVK